MKSTTFMTNPTVKVKTASGSHSTITILNLEAIKNLTRAQGDTTVYPATSTDGTLSDSEKFPDVTTPGRTEESVATEEPLTENSLTGN
jgi:hypothetical protein